jgi:hypothetical protein
MLLDLALGFLLLAEDDTQKAAVRMPVRELIV